MKQTIEIEVPEGKEAIWKDGRVFFIDKKLELPKTWEEFCNTHEIKKEEYFINIHSRIVPCFIDIGHETASTVVKYRNNTTDANLLPNKEAAKAHLALMQLHQLRDCYRQGWEPIPYEYSYSIYLWKSGDCVINRDWHRSEFLSFQSKEIAEEFLNNFRNLIEQAKDLI